MKMILAALYMLSLSAWAGDECRIPGQVFRRDFVRIEGEKKELSYTRQGSDDVPTMATFNGNFSIPTFKVFQETFCQTIPQDYTERVCQRVDVEVARGNGNQTLKDFFNLSLNLLKRANLFSSNVKFMDGIPSVERLEVSKKIIAALGGYAASRGIPNSWTAFSAMIQEAVSDGHIPASVYEDITSLYERQNRKSLGFLPLPGAEFEEGKGNGKLRKIFDLDLPAQTRANLVNSLINGTSRQNAHELSQSFIRFATTNGIPDSWDQFVIMLKEAVSDRSINEAEFRLIAVQFENANRENLGYELTAKICSDERRTRNVNVISRRYVKDFHAEVRKRFELSVSGAPLLKGEQEKVSVRYDGVAPFSLDADSSYNSYTLASSTEDNNSVRLNAIGSRKLVTPKNSAYAQLLKNGNNLGIKLQNTAFNPLIGGRVIIKVEYYEKIVLWPDRKIASRTYELGDGSLKEFLNQAVIKNPGRKHYAEVSLQVVGSKYFNNRFSEVKEFNL